MPLPVSAFVPVVLLPPPLPSPPFPHFAKVIPQVSQDSFDDVVRENIADFEMEPEEALKDAVEQFKSQGVDLSNVIIRVPLAEGEKHPAVVSNVDRRDSLAAATAFCRRECWGHCGALWGIVETLVLLFGRQGLASPPGSSLSS